MFWTLLIKLVCESLLQRRLSYPNLLLCQLLHSVDCIFHNLVALSLVGIIFCFTSCCLFILLTSHVFYVATPKSLNFFFATKKKKKRFHKYQAHRKPQQNLKYLNKNNPNFWRKWEHWFTCCERKSQLKSFTLKLKE